MVVSIQKSVTKIKIKYSKVTVLYLFLDVNSYYIQNGSSKVTLFPNFIQFRYTIDSDAFCKITYMYFLSLCCDLVKVTKTQDFIIHCHLKSPFFVLFCIRVISPSSSGRLQEMSHKIGKNSLKKYHFLTKIQNLPEII